MIITYSNDYNIEIKNIENYSESYKVTRISTNTNICSLDIDLFIPTQEIEIYDDNQNYLGIIEASISAKLVINFDSEDLIYYMYSLDEEHDIDNPTINISDIVINDYKSIDNIDYKFAYKTIKESLEQYYKYNPQLKITLSK